MNIRWTEGPCDGHCLSFQFSKVGLHLSESQLNPSPELEISTSHHLQIEFSFCVQHNISCHVFVLSWLPESD